MCTYLYIAQAFLDIYMYMYVYVYIYIHIKCLKRKTLVNAHVYVIFHAYIDAAMPMLCGKSR